jgi:Ca2+-binding RTX toxin-like protein
MRWTPPANGNGNGLASFTFEVVDSKLGVRSATDQTPNTITFNVTAVNDAPVIVTGGGLPATSVEVAENATAVTAILASDPDNTPTYAISGADAGLFNVNSATGVVTFKSSVDFEAPRDAGGNNVYDITLLATDGALTDAQSLQVFVRNIEGNTIVGTKKANTVDAKHAIGSRAATGEEDWIDGKKGNDKLNGLGGNDTLIGGAGKDSLTGGAGRDRLDGGRDADRFVFSAKLDVGGIDTIVKFKHDEDKLALENKVFKAIGGLLSADEFYAKAGAVKAHDKSDHVIYNKASGDLYYDKDGKGGAAAVLFATLSNKPTLDHGDFLIV